MLFLVNEDDDQINYLCECGQADSILKKKVKLNKAQDFYLLRFTIRCPNCKQVHENISLKINPDYKKKLEIAEKTKREAELKQVELIQKLSNCINRHLLTTSCYLEGYNIKDYKGLVSGESILGTGLFSSFDANFSDMLGVEATSYSNKLDNAKKMATNRMIESSARLNGNAIIGIDFDINIFKNDLICVSVNGTSVFVEKIEDNMN